MERNRRTLKRADGSLPISADFYAKATFVSFRLDGHDDLVEADVWGALGMIWSAAGVGNQERPGAKLRSRLTQRLRNHAAIVHHIDNALKNGVELTSDAAVRWYTTISAGLSINGLDSPALQRLAEIVRRVSFPQFRLQAALQSVATTYLRVLTEPLFPSFNGILARLLLHYHLGRCGLPAVLFDPVHDLQIVSVERTTRRLVEMLDQRFDELLHQVR